MPGDRPHPRVLIATAALAGAALAWLLPVSPEADAPLAFGRYGYPRFLLAAVLTAVAATALLVTCARDSRRRVVLLRSLAVWLGLVVALGAWEGLAHVLPPQRNPFYHFNEGGVAAGVPAHPGIPFLRPRHLDWAGPSRGDIPEWDVGDAPLREVRFRTDQDGFRNPADRTRADVVFLGDSFTEAGSVNAQDSFVELLGASLGASVRNLGLSSIGPQAELHILREFGLATAPRVVVWQVFEGNDLENALRHEERMLLLERGSDVRDTLHAFRNRAWMQRSPTYRLFELCVPRERWWPGGTFSTASGESVEMRFGYWPLVADHVPDQHRGWTAMRASLLAGRARLQREHIELIVLHVPMKMSVYGDLVAFDAWTRATMDADWDGTWKPVPADRSLATALARLCEEHGVAFADGTAALREAAARGELVYDPTDTHLSPRGHAVVATLLQPLVRRALDAR